MAFRHEALRIEEHLEKKLGVEIINPFYELHEEGKYMREFDNQSLTLPQFRANKLKENGPKYFENIVPSELEAIDNADGTLVLVPQIFSIGTFMEAYHSKALAKKPVYTLIYPKAESHPWIKYTSEKVIPVDFDDIAKKQDVPIDILEFEEWWQTGKPKPEESK